MDGEVGPALQQLGRALEQAGTTIAEISAVLQAAEAEAALLFQGEGAMTSPHEGADDALLLRAGGEGSGLPSGYRATQFQVSAALLAVGPGLVKFLEFVADRSNARGDTREAMRTIGRLLNELHAQQGHVGQLDRLYQTLMVKGLPFHEAT